MNIYYFDTSALIKRYVQETGTSWVLGVVATKPRCLLLTARITVVETHSALARRRRERSVSSEALDVAVREFSADTASEYEFVELDPNLVAVARDLVERYPLRAYDAVQLASAIIANRALHAAHRSSLTFVSADDRLVKVAAAEGMPVDNPNEHP
jgi:predicted nucleic acid-binding protein